MVTSAFSCLRDEQAGMMQEGQKKLYMSIGTRALDPAIDLRIIATDAMHRWATINKYPVSPDPVSGEYTIAIPEGLFNIYVLANEPVRLTSLLDQVHFQTDIFPLTLEFTEIPNVENPVNSQSATNIPLLAAATCLIRRSESDPRRAEVSKDHGTTWESSLHLGAERLASKISLDLRKQTPDSADRVTINNISLTNIPKHGYVMPRAYTEDAFTTVQPSDFGGGVVFSQNSADYTKIFSDLIIPEYIMQTPSDEDKAVCICIEATYNQKNVLYYIPVRGNLNISDYSLKRNRHYIIKGTITTEGELVFVPEVRYEVADWTDAESNNNFEENPPIIFAAAWANGTIVSSPYVVIRNNEVAEFYFMLNTPENATWTASLTNPQDFEFDTVGGVTFGKAVIGNIYTIRIKPRRDIELNSVLSEFYITVNTGSGQSTELDLPNAVVGNNRYKIIHIP